MRYEPEPMKERPSGGGDIPPPTVNDNPDLEQAERIERLRALSLDLVCWGNAAYAEDVDWVIAQLAQVEEQAAELASRNVDLGIAARDALNERDALAAQLAQAEQIVADELGWSPTEVSLARWGLALAAQLTQAERAIKAAPLPEASDLCIQYEAWFKKYRTVNWLAADSGEANDG